MAKKSKNEDTFSYKDTVNEIKTLGPGRLYLIWGAEDYLSEQIFLEIKKLCISDEADDFSYRKLTERDFSAAALAEAIDSVPFLSERSLVELRGIDINKTEESEEIIKLLSDIPEYCTVVFIYHASFEPDKRLKLYKCIAKYGKEIKTKAQSGDMLIRWIVKRFAAHGKRIEITAAQRLISVSGELMNGLIPEIDKLSAYVKGDTVKIEDVERIAIHIPDAVVFDMTDQMANGNYNAALNLLAELLADRNNEPLMMMGVIGAQMRKLYAAKMAIESGEAADYLMRVSNVRHEFVANKLMSMARKFSTAQLRRAVEIVAETDYAMKSAGTAPTELLKDCILRIAMGDGNA